MVYKNCICYIFMKAHFPICPTTDCIVLLSLDAAENLYTRIHALSEEYKVSLSMMRRRDVNPDLPERWLIIGTSYGRDGFPPYLNTVHITCLIQYGNLLCLSRTFRKTVNLARVTTLNPSILIPVRGMNSTMY